LIVTVFQFLFGALLLYYGAEYLIKSGKLIANKLGVPSIFIGITVVAFGTSLPELIVSIYANLSGEQEIVLGNIIGSNIANIGLILGLTAVIYPISFNFKISKIDFYFLTVITVLFSFFLYFEMLSMIQGILFLLSLTFYCVYLSRTHRNDYNEKFESFNYQIIILFFVGVFGLWLGSDLFVRGAISLAEYFGVSSLAIGMTIVALGTSIPELATSLVAASKGESEIAVGNILGSNLFNILAVMGLTLVINDMVFDFSIIQINVIIMLVFTLLLVIILKYFNRISRLTGLLFLAGYVYSFIIMFL
jgi:cation:H+ antiporter